MFSLTGLQCNLLEDMVPTARPAGEQLPHTPRAGQEGEFSEYVGCGQASDRTATV